MSGNHDLWLVALPVAVAVIAAYIALDLAVRAAA